MASAIAEFVGECPIIDNHCHPLVSEGFDPSAPNQCTLLGSFSEASGEALQDARHAIAVKRGIRELCSFLGVPQPWTIEALEAARRRQGLHNVRQKLFASCRLRALLIDDGLRSLGALPVARHGPLVPCALRVFRIEAAAEDILGQDAPGGGAWTLGAFEAKFRSLLDPLPENVVALKTIAAYRCGLNILASVAPSDAEAGLQEALRSRSGAGAVRVKDRRFISFLVQLAMELAHRHDIPLQVHSGFGDKDLDLRLANPVFLRPLLEAQEQDGNCARIVLLHCSYPFCREAGYLATVYKNVYLDCGLVFGKMSSHGMLFCTQSLLELAPLNKIMFSTDAYGFADAYFLACKQGRAMLTRTLEAAVSAGDLTQSEALDAAADILHNNALRVYRLGERKNLAQVSSPTTAAPPAPSLASVLVKGGGGDPVVSDAAQGGAGEGECAMVRLLLADLSGQRRTKVVPWHRYRPLVEQQGVGFAKCIFGFPSFEDGPVPGCGFNASGEVRLIPDPKTLRPLPWCASQSVVLVSAHSVPGTPFPCCPRATLHRISQELFLEFNLMVRAAFESEFTLLKDTSPSLIPVDQTLYCSSSAFDSQQALLSDVVASLHALNIPVELVHAEAGHGQFEIATAHAPAMDAADNVLLVREAAFAAARKRGLHATFLPSVFPGKVSNGAHAHLSIWRQQEDSAGSSGGASQSQAGGGWENAFTGSGAASDEAGMSEQGRWFMAGVLEHLPAIMAISCPLPNSFERIRPNYWAGAFKCWGFENREAALRVAAPPTLPASGSTGHHIAAGASIPAVTNFEMKACDAAAQPHLVLATVIAAGMDGLSRQLPLPPALDVNPADLTGKEAVPRLPKSLNEAIDAFSADRILQEALGRELSQAIIAVRKAEASFYDQQPPDVAIQALVHKY